MRAVVSGGTRGIGLAVCRLLLEKGYSVTALYASDGEGARRAAEELPSAEFVRADVSEEQSVAEVFSRVKTCDLLVNNAGISHFAQVQDVSFEDYRRVMDVNFGGTLFCTKYAVKKMLSRGGAIVNVASVWGETGGSCESVYSASKGAVIAFTKALAKELAPAGITVNCVCPGVIETKMNGHLTPDERKALREEIPLGRFGSAEEVASAVVSLAENRYITGQILGVNGGFYI